MLVFWLSLALADAPPEPTAATEVAEATDVDPCERVLSAECLSRYSPAERVDLGWDRIWHGDYAGAEILATEAFREEGPHREEASYLYGYALEWGGKPDKAVEIYGAMLEQWPEGGRALDARFRLAAALGAAGQPREAHRALKPLRRADLSEKDERKVQLLRGIWLLKDDKIRRGLRLLSILADEQGVAPWLEAHALSAHVDLLVRESGKLELDVRSRKQTKRLQTRATYMAALEPLIGQTIELEQSHWILAELKAAGNGYEAVGDDLLAAREPKLTEAQLEIYRDTVAERVEVVWTKAMKWYELGIRHALNVGYSQDLLHVLEADRDRVMGKLDGL